MNPNDIINSNSQGPRNGETDAGFAKLLESFADSLIEAAAAMRHSEETGTQHRQRQLQFFQQTEANLNRQQDNSQQALQRLAGMEQRLDLLSRNFAKVLEFGARLEQRAEAAGFNLEQVRLLTDAVMQKQQQLVDDFIERRVTDHLYKQFLDIQNALSRYSANGNPNLKADVQAVAENITTFLAESGLRIIHPNPGTAFDPREHQPVKVVTATQTQAEGNIAETFTPGLARNQRVILPARVAVFKNVG